MLIQIRTIPHDEQRYETCGDYWTTKDGQMHIRVSDMGNEDYEFLVAFHELIEFWLIRKAGISEESINLFDIQYEKNRKSGDTDEPGNQPDAPYHLQHLFATDLEMMMAAAIGIDWKAYEARVNLLSQTINKPNHQ